MRFSIVSSRYAPTAYGVIRRRRVIRVLAGALFIAPLSSRGEKQRTYRIGFLSLTSPWEAQDEFRDRLRQLGYIDGQNITVDYRFANGDRERLDRDASDLVKDKVDVILGVASPGAAAAYSATHTIPVVFVFTQDPVGKGYAASLALPGRNMTGQTGFTEDLNPKRLELLKAAVPDLSRMAVLMHAKEPSHESFLKNLSEPANRLQIQLHPVTVQDAAHELNGALDAMARGGAQAFIAFPTQLFFVQRQSLGTLALAYRLPGIADAIQYAEAGLLMSYGVNYGKQYRRAAEYVDKILKGAKPGDLPIEQPTELDFGINVSSAKAMGLTIKPSVIQQATKVIE